MKSMTEMKDWEEWQKKMTEKNVWKEWLERQTGKNYWKVEKRLEKIAGNYDWEKKLGK